MKNNIFSFPTAIILLVSTWLIYFYLLHDAQIQYLVYLGWFTLVIGYVFIFLPIFALRSRGKPEKGKDFTQTTSFVSGGIYDIVRHPIYLGWSFMYIAVILFSQHWIILIMGIFGVICMCMICDQEDQHLRVKFGSKYEKYIETVPSMNILIGIYRKLRKPLDDQASH